MPLSGGQRLPPVQKLVATMIFFRHCERKCNRVPQSPPPEGRKVGRIRCGVVRIRKGFGTGDPSPTASPEGGADAGGFRDGRPVPYGIKGGADAGRFRVTRQKTRPLREDGRMTGGMHFGWLMILKNPFGRIMIDI